MTAFDPVALLSALAREGTDFVVIGQAAAVLHGHRRQLGCRVTLTCARGLFPSPSPDTP